MAHLQDLALPFDGRYFELSKPKRNGGTRIVYDPHPDLKAIQKKINSRIFRAVFYPRYLYGGIRDTLDSRDYIKCATVHCPSGVVAQLDIDGFFDNILFHQIYEVFTGFFHYSPDVSNLLARICAKDEFNLPQGAPTSVALSNLVFVNDEPNLVRHILDSGARYTRFIDDITISHPDSKFPIEKYAKATIRIIERNGFRINESKSGTLRDTGLIDVFGIRVNGAIPRTPQNYSKNLRRKIYQLEELAKIPNERKQEGYRTSWNSTSGRLAKLKRTSSGKYRTYRKRLNKIKPLTHEREARRVKAKTRRMLVDSQKIQNPEAFKKRYQKLMHEIGSLKSTYPALNTSLKSLMAQVRENMAEE